jgi:hypothetical protein
VHVIAGASPDNTPAGYYWTFLFPMLLFIVIAVILWALFGRPHHRVPTRRVALGLSSQRAVPDTAGYVGMAATATTTEGTGADTAAEAGAPGTTTVVAESDAGSDEPKSEQPSADGAGAGE